MEDGWTLSKVEQMFGMVWLIIALLAYQKIGWLSNIAFIFAAADLLIAFVIAILKTVGNQAKRNREVE